MSGGLAAARRVCPKHMASGPCGGVRADGTCEVDAGLTCPYPAVLGELPWRAPWPGPETPAPGATGPRSDGRLEATLRGGGFAVVAEAHAPDSADLGPFTRRYAAMRGSVTAANVADHALATPHASGLAAAALLERAGVETIVNLSCRDRNAIALQGDLLGAAALGVPNVLCVTGDHPALGDDGAQAVYELDSFGLIRLARRLRDDGLLRGGRVLEERPRLLVGAAANPFTPPEAVQAERVAAKVAAGADFLMTQAVFDLPAFAAFARRLRDHGGLERAWLLAGVAPVTSLEQAWWLRREVPGARVGDDLIRRLERTLPQRRRAAGLAWAADTVARLRGLAEVSGVLLFPLLDDVAAIGELAALHPADPPATAPTPGEP